MSLYTGIKFYILQPSRLASSVDWTAEAEAVSNRTPVEYVEQARPA